ncbi:MAG: hypothetical protein GXY92_03275 [Syntrophomonadaceae bacterium]|nr:hypothetical protein [Syntrophomonadaceae bacterium]
MDFFRRQAPVLHQVVALAIIIGIIIWGHPSSRPQEEAIPAKTVLVAAVNDSAAAPADTGQSEPAVESADLSGKETVTDPETKPGEEQIPATAEPAVGPEAESDPEPKAEPPANSKHEPAVMSEPAPTAKTVGEAAGESPGESTEIPADDHADMIPEYEKAVSAEVGDRDKTAGSDVSRGQNTARAIINHALRCLGAPYRYGGTTPNGFDCSGFVRYVFNQVDIQLPRSSRDQASVGAHVDKSQLLPADLVFFKTDGSSRINHVGIYLGGNNFVHASRNHGIVITSLDDKYYLKAYCGARRVINQ